VVSTATRSNNPAFICFVFFFVIILEKCFELTASPRVLDSQFVIGQKKNSTNLSCLFLVMGEKAQNSFRDANFFNFFEFKFYTFLEAFKLL